MKPLRIAGIVLATMIVTGGPLIAPVFATPPTPPAEFQMLPAEMLAKIEPRDGAFPLPIQVRVTDRLERLSLEWRLRTTDPLQPKVVERGSQRLDPDRLAKQPGSIEVDIPALREDGRYRVEIELVGRFEGRDGVLDRLVVYEIVEAGRASLVTPAALRRSDTSGRRRVFVERLKKYPDDPDIRLLSPDTVVVPGKLAASAKQLKDRPPLLVRGAGPGDDIRPYVHDRTDESWTDMDPITVRGRIVYLDFEGTWRPLVNVSVNLYDDDTFGDEHLGTTTTDWNGDWSFSVNNDDGFLQNGRDVYYKFHLGNTRLHLRDSDGDNYRWKSAVRDDRSDGAVVDYGSETGSTNPESMQVFAILNLGWNHVATAGGQDPGHVEARFPTSGSFFSRSDQTVNIDSGNNDGPDVILHEYGHALMYYAFSGASISPGGSHGFGDDAQDPGLAYSEGWASGFMLSLCPDGMYNWAEGTNEGAGEWPTCTNQNDTGRQIERFSDAGNRIGEKNEGRVAAAINDFRDAPDDDNGGSQNRGRDDEDDSNAQSRIGLATIYRDSMWGFVHNDFLDFWITFAGNLSGTTRDRANDIMQYNWMSLPVEISCVASKIAVAGRRDATNLLTGLRAFRDLGLKPLQGGRQWIQTYYSHSPEIAMLLIGDPEARKAALIVVEHFSRLGNAFGNHGELVRLSRSNEPAIPREVRTAVERVLQTLEESGSAELQREIEPLRREIDAFEGLTVAEAMRRVQGMAPAQKGRMMLVIDPRDLAPTSRGVDWELIRKSILR